MSGLSEADRYLLDQIRQGSAVGWSQFVDRYQGRLLAFARSRLPPDGDAEDMVQETFVSLLGGMDRFRGEASLETYLFSICRRKIINAFRGRARRVCLLQDAMPGGAESASDEAGERLAAPDPTASWYARRDEAHDRQRGALSSALGELVDHFKRSRSFRDLQIIEMLFFGQLRNKDVAGIAGVTENHVALVKHRSLKQVREHVARMLGPRPDCGGDIPVAPPDTLLGDIWQEDRLSCLKRSTIGGHLLGTLEEPWEGYVAFHLDRLGCSFCRANLEDLRRQTSDETGGALRTRILESTIGFLHPP